MRVLIDGVAVPEDEAFVSVFDWGIVRGYGVFEVVRSYGGRVFGLDPHLDRMEVSAELLGIGLPPRSDLRRWIASQAEIGGDCLVRTYVTAGSRDELFDSPQRTVVFWEPVPQVPATGYRVLPLAAPWAPGGDHSELTGAKTLSYANNMRATEEARGRGFHDALLLSRDGVVIEGPTFTVAWFRDGVLETPALDLGILASITRSAAVEAAGRLGIEVAEGRYPLERITAADEAVAMSTVKEVLPIVAVGQVELPAGPLSRRLADTFHGLVIEDVGTKR
jgi:branched-subunit amino acid aminotransferase/4-amino-4-deoxychorismate lyase